MEISKCTFSRIPYMYETVPGEAYDAPEYSVTLHA
jgi:hypothetical protein